MSTGAQVQYSGSVEQAIARNLRFGIAQALNAVARNAATEIRAEMSRELELRQAAFTRFFVRGPSPAATARRLVSRVVVGAPASAANRDRGTLVLQHDEEGTGTKAPIKGSRIMVPSREQRDAARPNKVGNAASWRATWKDLTAGKDAANIRRGKLVAMGKRRSTYAIISRRSGRLLVYERRGRGRRNTELLFFSASRVRLRRRTGARRLTARVVGREIARQARVAIATALVGMQVRGLRTAGGLR